MRHVPSLVIGCGTVILGDSSGWGRTLSPSVTSPLAQKESQQQQPTTPAVYRLRFVTLFLREQRARFDHGVLAVGHCTFLLCAHNTVLNEA